MDKDLRGAERELGSAPELPATWQKYACDLERAGADEATLFSKIVGHCGRFVKELVLSEAAKVTQWPQCEVILVDPKYEQHLANYTGHRVSLSAGFNTQANGGYTFVLLPEKGVYHSDQQYVGYLLSGDKLVTSDQRLSRPRLANEVEFTPQDYVSQRTDVLAVIDRMYGSGSKKSLLQRFFGSTPVVIEPDVNRRATIESILSAAGTVVQEKLLPRLEALAEQSHRVSIIDFEPALSSLADYNGHLDEILGVEIVRGLHYVEKELVTMPAGDTQFYRDESRKISHGHFYHEVPKYHEREVQPTRLYIEHLPRILELLAPTETVQDVEAVDFTSPDDEVYLDGGH